MKSIRKNFLYNAVYQLLVIVLPLITAPYVSRKLGATELGVYSYTYSVVYYFQLFAMLGISNHGNRSIAAIRDDRGKTSRVFCQIYSIQKITFTIAILLYLLYIYFFNIDNHAIALIQLIYLISGLMDISWFFFGLEEFKLTVTRNVIIKFMTTIFVLGFVDNANDTWKYALILAGGTLLSQGYLWAFIGKYRDKVKINVYELKEHIIPILTMFIPVLAYSIYKVLDKIMLGNMSSYDQVGFYQNAEKIISIPTGVITALGTVMLPRMANLMAHGENERVKSYIAVSFKVVTIIGSAIAFGLISISDLFVPVFFGTGYEECIDLIRFLSLIVFFMAWANVIRTQYLIPHHKDKIYLISTFAGAIVNLLINLALIPKYSATGAAVGTVFAEFSVMLIQVILVRKELPIIKYFLEQIPYLLIGTIMCILVYFVCVLMPTNIFALFISTLIGAVFYCLLITCYSYLIRDEIYSFIDSAFQKLNIIKK